MNIGETPGLKLEGVGSERGLSAAGYTPEGCVVARIPWRLALTAESSMLRLQRLEQSRRGDTQPYSSPMLDIVYPPGPANCTNEGDICIIYRTDKFCNYLHAKFNVILLRLTLPVVKPLCKSCVHVCLEHPVLAFTL